MEEYDIVVLGGGSGSQVATAAADRGLEAAVLEPGPLGGACVTRGCVPSKALIHRADLVSEIRRADRFGIDADLRGVEYGAVTEAVHDTVYARADRQRESLERADGVTRYRTAGRFVDERTVELDDGGDRIRGEDVVIAVGSRPVAPPIDGLDDVDYLTSDDALYLDERPDSLAIVGGGYIGAELGYFFAALGTEVSIVGRSDRLVPREDDDVSDLVTASIDRYCEVYAGHEARAVRERDDGSVAVAVEAGDDEETEVAADALLVAAGRRPNTDTLDPENAGVEVDDRGHVEVDERLATTADGVWALGDVLAAYPFKHVADYESRVVAANVLDDAGETVDYEGVPHAIFTSPQVASVGETEGELAEAGVEYESTLVTYDAAPKGLILGEDESFVKVLAEPGGGEILGCHVVGPEAATMIHEVAVTIQSGPGTVDAVADAVHVHPALNEVVLKAFDDLSSRSYSTAPDWRGTNG
ncbi:dihydrolipoyl dehydrogenase [Salinilacihabitans rarus]|uniref:dihydrolipoyl dehydrogenase n=1 Tax=Salinilacihabitans rarus TaxID=2961596 RepID=UPI0020C87FAF|nr:dihydrolipoyl dehydrogenase [Salinilacihabitans rarus]